MDKIAKKKTKKKSQHHRYIFVLGGVMSGVGKGITASSIGKILQLSGYSVTAVKIDPYINVDAGTMNPIEHGETFVLEDGYETDQDMGNYERFLGCSLSHASYMTTGSIYQRVIARERSLGYHGKTVSVVPHVPLEVISQIEQAAKKEHADITIVEVGGTVGEYENILFLEAARMMKRKFPSDVLFVLVSYLPVPGGVHEMKTKPTQQAVRTIGESGITPDFIVGRSSVVMDGARKQKIAESSLLQVDDIISAPDVESVYDIPDNFIREQLDIKILKKFGLKRRSTQNTLVQRKSWNAFIRSSKTAKEEINIAVVGKYFTTGDFVLSDAYVSVIEALKYSGWKNKVRVHIEWISSQRYEGKNGLHELHGLKHYDGVLVPGGFGTSGIEGKILVINYVRKNKIPFFGICLGMQMATVAFARDVLGYSDAHSTEMDPLTKHPMVIILPEQQKKLAQGDYGGSMRLGNYPAWIKSATIARSIYKTATIFERHRHRYEINSEYRELLEQQGLIISATSPDGLLPEIMELPRKIHPFFLAVQFHPELRARPLDPHPLFTAFVASAYQQSKRSPNSNSN